MNNPHKKPYVLNVLVVELMFVLSFAISSLVVVGPSLKAHVFDAAIIVMLTFLIFRKGIVAIRWLVALIVPILYFLVVDVGSRLDAIDTIFGL